MSAADLTHAASAIDGRAYCGRKKANTSRVWRVVDCRDCLAARRADLAAERVR